MMVFLWSRISENLETPRRPTTHLKNGRTLEHGVFADDILVYLAKNEIVPSSVSKLVRCIGETK